MNDPIAKRLPEDDDNILEITEGVKAGLIRYANAERARMPNPIIKPLITWKSLAQKILLNAIQKQGHWDPSPNASKPASGRRRNQ